MKLFYLILSVPVLIGLGVSMHDLFRQRAVRDTGWRVFNIMAVIIYLGTLAFFLGAAMTVE